nr:PREDICTED: leucine-rich repeat-containing protein 15-like [Tribolium castaneum]|eukprot:XP_008191739.2 PREDICTED: leucine-rich repeat-containing protein 15-like [Tribolium castaneum]
MSIIIILFVLILRQCSCECSQTYMTVCDKVEDIFDRNVCSEAQATICTDLLIKSEVPRKLVNLNLKSLYDKLCRYDLKNLIIVGQFIADATSANCVASCLFGLENLSFYGNEIKILRRFTFPAAEKLRKLSLVKNRIENVDFSSFSLLNVANIDLSYNNIQAIEEGTFNHTSLSVVNLQHNQIAFLDPGSFGANLELLDLSYNKLVSIKDQVFAHTKNIRELILSHNQLWIVPDLNQMSDLRAVGLSNNEIRTVYFQEFRSVRDLRLLDLSHNKLDEATEVLKVFANKNHLWALSLAFNNLENIDFSAFNNVTTGFLMLYGNPWRCNKWDQVERILRLNFINWAQCDFNLFSSGFFPYCIADSIEDSEVESARKRFRDAVTHELLKMCHIDIHSERYNLLYPHGTEYMCF